MSRKTLKKKGKYKKVSRETTAEKIEAVSIRDLISHCQALEMNSREISVKMGLETFARTMLQSKMNLNIPLEIYGKEFSSLLTLKKFGKKDINIKTSDNFFYTENTKKGILYIWEVAKFNGFTGGISKRSSTNIDFHKKGKITSDVMEALFNVILLKKNNLEVEELSIVYLCINSNSDSESAQTMRIYSDTKIRDMFLAIAEETFDKKIQAYRSNLADSLACWDGKRCNTCPQQEKCNKEFVIKSMLEMPKQWKNK